jgi:hemolysin activation/secretion protein
MMDNLLAKFGRYEWSHRMCLTLLALFFIAQTGLSAVQSASPPVNASQSNGSTAPGGQAVQPPQSPPADSRTVYIQEYRVQGAHLLSPIEVEEAVYPFLGPGRTADDVDQARGALEKAYQNKGYQTVSVQIPAQQVTGGIVVLQVIERKVGRLRVKGARYYSPDQIKRAVPSLTEGTVPDFNRVTREIVALNQLPDRRVTPSLKAGMEPNTVDIDLNTKDSLPLHGSLELNNRYSPNTTELRLNGAVSYNNLWQLGHSIGFSFQLAPQNIKDAEVYSAYYLLRFAKIEWLSLLLQGTKQDSNVSTLGGTAVSGKNEVAGFRAVFALPPGKNFFHSVSAGMDYKHYNQGVSLSNGQIQTPLTYYPISVLYSATWLGHGYETDVNAGLTFNLRGMGSTESEFDNNRFKATGSFVYLRGDLSETIDLPRGFQLFAKVQGQLADQPLVNSEQFAGGGLTTVRGYLEAEELGDNAIFGSIELRSPSLLSWLPGSGNEWRVYAFVEGGELTLRDPLPEQTSRFDLASFGFGSRIRLQDHFNGTIDAGVPLISQSATVAHDVRVTFRMWAEF